MSFRFRLGPFTFGRGGARLSLWSFGSGVSVPLSRKQRRSFGKVGFGPFSWYFGGASTKPPAKRNSRAKVAKKQQIIGSQEGAAIKALGSDELFLRKLQKQGVPWRGVQERLKEELPEGRVDRDDVAYRLVPEAMNAVFGQQNTAWKTVKRPSKRGRGLTTWVVIIDTGA